MRTIRITGKGSMSVRPDMTRITVTLQGLYPVYSEALRHSSEDTSALRGIIGTFGFSGDDLKTLSFNVDTEYEGYTENNEYKQRFAGYRYRHMMKLEFGIDNDRLGKLLTALAESPLDPEFHLSYTVADRDSVRSEALVRSVEDSREKAVSLAAAAGVALGEIQTIDHSWGNADMEVHTMNYGASQKCLASARNMDSLTMDITPDDIAVEDTVTIVWEIK